MREETRLPERCDDKATERADKATETEGKNPTIHESLCIHLHSRCASFCFVAALRKQVTMLLPRSVC